MLSEEVTHETEAFLNCSRYFNPQTTELIFWHQNLAFKF
jgi:hypothetical protein